MAIERLHPAKVATLVNRTRPSSVVPLVDPLVEEQRKNVFAQQNVNQNLFVKHSFSKDTKQTHTQKKNTETTDSYLAGLAESRNAAEKFQASVARRVRHAVRHVAVSQPISVVFCRGTWSGRQFSKICLKEASINRTVPRGG